MEDDKESGRPQITTWETLKKEIKDHFLPSNASWMARESLKRLKQIGTVRDYVMDFSSLMLDIKNMSDDAKLFNFMFGLQGWAQTELRRQGVRDLPTAMATADYLVDYKLGNTVPTQKAKSDGNKKAKFEGKNHKKAGWKNLKGKTPGEQVAVTKPTEKGGKTAQPANRPTGCFICTGPHRARDCPKREKLSALVTGEDKANSDSDEGPSRVNPLQLLNVIRGQSTTPKALMFVETLVNGVRVKAMMDSGATHNFVAMRESERLGLNLKEDTSHIKAMNSKAQKIQGIAKNVAVHVGNWKGKCNLLCVQLDDFDLILGVDFFLKAKVALLPHLGGLMFLEESMPCFVQAIQEGGGKKDQQPELLSAIQLKKGLKQGLETYVAAWVEIKEGQEMEVPDSVARLLHEFADVMPTALPKELPPRRPIDHRIELIPRSKPPALAPYRMSPAELLELRKQLKELLDAGLI